MGLKDLVDETKSSEGSGLSQFYGVKANKEKLRNPELCPSCGSDDTEKVHYYRRCNNDDGCDVLTYIPTRHSIDRDKWTKK